MTRLAITGHRGLPPMTENLIDTALRGTLTQRAYPELVGLSCLADGVDSLFAQAVLDAGGTLIVIVPATQYRDGLPENHHPTYDAILQQATNVIRLDHTESDPQAHMDASLCMIDEADELIAVWDGEPARGYGGTADVVAAAEDRAVPVTIIWPDGATRD
ncbi:MAG: hypothetical protein ACR2GH_16615 [Pseudonocardia sp.]